MEKIKIGVIGTGHLGKFHTKLFKEIDSCEMIGVFDTDYQRANEVANEFSVQSFDLIDNLLHYCDAVSIAAVTSAHHSIAKECLSRNKHVFVEKPITATIEQAEEIVKLARDKNLILQVGHVERFNPALLSLDNFELKPMFIQSDRLAQFNPRGTDVAVVLDLMIHDIDIILSLIKSEVTKVEASGVAVVSDSLDIANARIEFENGAVANVTASRISQKKMRKMRIFQKDSYISIDFDSGLSEVFRLISLEETPNPATINYGEIGIGEKKKRIIYEQPEVKEVNALKHELSLFINSVNTNSRPVVSGEDGLKALVVAQQIINKIKESKVGV